MNSETKSCQNCKSEFVIAPEDFLFYEKIQVPPPTFCPECRMIRRSVWRNVRSLNKRECGLCKKSLISMYSNEKAPVYCSECWNGDGWDQFKYAREYDFSKNFFTQLKEIFDINPRFYAYKLGNLINSEFTNFSKDNKNAYLSYSVIGCEDILYSENIDFSKKSVDCLSVNKLDNCFYNIDCESNYNTHYAIQSNNCIDSNFIFDCTNCSNCCLSSNLRNQQYVFNNQRYSKEEYFKKVEDLKLNTYLGFESIKSYFEESIFKKGIHKYSLIYNSPNSTGDYIRNSKNIKNSFTTADSENIAYSVRVLDRVKDSYDLTGLGFNCELIYESMAATSSTYRDFFCYLTTQGSRECEYSLILKNCSNCFGCVGLINAQYCILNKQYEEKEYFEMVERIKTHMNEMPYIDGKGRIFKYGEFFPYDMCPFGYNETQANDFFPLNKEDATYKGYPWREKEKKDYYITIDSRNLPDDIANVSESILNEVIACPNEGNIYQCTSAYKIVSAELQFYKSKNLPLPRLCPNCRHYERLKYRNTMRLYKRKCMKEGCNNEFEATYSPDRPETIYCEKCYQQEVY